MVKIADEKVPARILRDAEIEAVSGGLLPNLELLRSLRDPRQEAKARLQAAWDARGDDGPPEIDPDSDWPPKA